MALYGVNISAEVSKPITVDDMDAIIDRLLGVADVVSVDGGIDGPSSFEVLVGVRVNAPGFDESDLATSIVKDSIEGALGVGRTANTTVKESVLC